MNTLTVIDDEARRNRHLERQTIRGELLRFRLDIEPEIKPIKRAPMSAKEVTWIKL